jgi:hypothetical protein
MVVMDVAQWGMCCCIAVAVFYNGGVGELCGLGRWSGFGVAKTLA